MVDWNNVGGGPPEDKGQCDPHKIHNPNVPDITCGSAVKLEMIAAFHKALATVHFGTMRGARVQCKLASGHYFDLDFKLIGAHELLGPDPNA